MINRRNSPSCTTIWRTMRMARALGAASLLLPAAGCALPPPPASEVISPLLSRDVEVGGKALHFIIRPGDPGAPTILLEAGATLDSTEWTGVIDRLAPCTSATLVAYDRAGMGRSAALSTPYDIEQEVARLHAALRRQHLSGPLLLVAHSFGGYLIQLYAHRYAKDVVGAVYIDANTVDGIGGSDGARALIAPVIAAAAKGSTGFNDMRLAERYVETTEHMATIPPPRDIPVAVITRGAQDQPGASEGERRWRAGHAALARATSGRLVFAPGASHFIPTERPDLVAQVIGDMLADRLNTSGRCSAD